MNHEEGAHVVTRPGLVLMLIPHPQLVPEIGAYQTWEDPAVEDLWIAELHGGFRIESDTDGPSDSFDTIAEAADEMADILVKRRAGLL